MTMGDELGEHHAAAALRQYSEGGLSLVHLEAKLGGRVTFERPGSPGVVYINAPLPIVALERAHLLAAPLRAIGGQTTASELASRAATLIVLRCYGIEVPGPEQDVSPAQSGSWPARAHVESSTRQSYAHWLTASATPPPNPRMQPTGRSGRRLPLGHSAPRARAVERRFVRGPGLRARS